MNQKTELWIGLVHLKPLKKGRLEEAAGVYTNIITWAHAPPSFNEKADTIAATMNLYVVETEGEEPLENRFGTSTLSEELEDMRSRAKHNPNAIVFGTFHAYPFDDA